MLQIWLQDEAFWKWRVACRLDGRSLASIRKRKREVELRLRNPPKSLSRKLEVWMQNEASSKGLSLGGLPLKWKRYREVEPRPKIPAFSLPKACKFGSRTRLSGDGVSRRSSAEALSKKDGTPLQTKEVEPRPKIASLPP
ncbi:MAG: hypothetical protein JWM04_2425 [Verrucomicrobiales bacterium]|nr:hypothetical protein [Verrucomicrobiales bacterium]